MSLQARLIRSDTRVTTMQTILGEVNIMFNKFGLVVALAAFSFDISAFEEIKDKKWEEASIETQSQALSFVEDVSRARSAGLSVAASEIGVSDTVAASKTSDLPKIQHGTQKRFGNVLFDTQLREENGKPVVILEASQGCIHRDFAKQKLLLGRVVSPPLANDPRPTFGYALFSGGSAATMFFDATGSKCLTGVRIEDPTRLTRQIRESELEAGRK